MADGSDSRDAREPVIPSESILGDLAYAVAFGVGAVLLFYSGLYVIAFVAWRAGIEAEAFGYENLTPPSTELSTLAPYLFAYVGWLGAAVSGVLAGYCAVVRPVQRLLGSGADGGGAGRAPLSIETTVGTRTVAPDSECVDCEKRAIGVVATEFEADTPSRVIPVCPQHLHERRDELEAQSHRVEVETFV